MRIKNRTARHLWLQTQGLGETPTGALDVLAMIRQLGYVQLDTIQVVARAHHHILWSRNQKYREKMLNPLMAKDRSIFEHFSHDACVIPMEFLPMWRLQFERKRQRIERAGWYSTMPDATGREAIKARIRAEGALSTHAFDTKISGPKEMWARPPHKLALDYMWYSGELATCYRENFTKYYNLAERVFPKPLSDVDHSEADQMNWLCGAALDRLGFGSPGDIQRFWGVMDAKETRTWVDGAAQELQQVEVETFEGDWIKAVAPADIEARLEGLEPPTARLRILNPFDPAMRDRTRLERLFGFEYRVEMFVPAAKRRWGYYVFPILEGDRFVGRIEIKADRKQSALNVLNFWQEAGVAWPRSRFQKLDAEIARMARFIGVRDVSRMFCS